jgi:Protein of unknown function (Hypoth_ymh)
VKLEPIARRQTPVRVTRAFVGRAGRVAGEHCSGLPAGDAHQVILGAAVGQSTHHMGPGSSGASVRSVDCGSVDYDWAASVLAQYVQFIDDAKKAPWLSKDRRDAVRELKALRSTVNNILRSLGPGLGSITGPSLPVGTADAELVQRALHLIAGSRIMDGAQEQLGYPALPLPLLHRLVFAPARLLWGSGNYRHAVSDAATNVSNFAQTRLGRHDISDKDLMAQAFSDKEPEQGKPRLRCPGDPASQDVRSQQNGALIFSQGCFQAIRNPAHHMTGDWNPVMAFEQLAALSIVARWVSEWDLVQCVSPEPQVDPAKVAEVWFAQQASRQAGTVSDTATS